MHKNLLQEDIESRNNSLWVKKSRDQSPIPISVHWEYRQSLHRWFY